MLVDLNTVLAIAEEKKCAIPAFNVYNAETALGVIFAAEEAHSCVILQMYSRLFSSFEAEFMAPALVEAARKSKVKVAFHLDHGADDAVAAKALRWGCTGVMRDASTLPLEENIAVLKNVTAFCHAAGVPVEGELGHIGAAKDGVGTEYTKVDEAVRYVNETGVDALAIMVGTAHGHYKQAPVLAIDRIKEIHAATKAHLVLHGGSGVPDDQIRAAIQAGIRKINFGTDLCCAFLNEVMDTDPGLIAVDLFMKKPIEAVKAFALSRIALLGAEGSDDA
ncbi:MAG: class II fructose-bisphosphate aldolase [Clostridiales bacterium]|nr:class II fructose-bisphosphate aldolase [Clostridiales bacterium]